MQKLRHDKRPGAAASATSRLWIVTSICAFQYWLLTSSIEAWHSGNHNIVWPAFIVSVVCFMLAAGLIVTGEIGARKVGKDLAETVNDSKSREV